MKRDGKIELLLAALLRDKPLFVEVMHRFTDDLFVEDDYNLFVQQLRKFYEMYKRNPTFDEFRLFVPADIWDAFFFVQDVFATDAAIASSVAREKLYEYYQSSQTRKFISQVEGKLLTSKLDLRDAYSSMRELVRKTAKADKSCVVLKSSTIADQYIQARDHRLGLTAPLAFKNITRIVEGVAKGELVIYIAPSSRGKTLTLMNEAYTGIVNDENVLIVSMENEPPSIISRLCTRILLATKRQQRQNEAACKKFLERFYRYVKEPAIIYRPANTLSVVELDLWLDEYTASTGVVFDRIIVDYLNKFRKSKGSVATQMFEVERLLTDELRALAIAKNVRIITAAQTSRRGIASDDNTLVESIDETHIQGGFGQFETADIVLGYSETPAEKRRGSGRVKILKMREGGGRGLEFVVAMAPWIGLITDAADEMMPADKKDLLINPDKSHEQLSGLRTAISDEEADKRAIPKRTKKHAAMDS